MGLPSQNLNTNKNDMPWRAGANETTTITFEHDVKVEGKDIKRVRMACIWLYGLRK
jgi:Protein of unknown function (DUF2911).